VEQAAPRFAVFTAAAVLLLAASAPAFGAPGPDPSPGSGSGPQPDPSGGRTRVVVPVRTAPAPRVVVTPAKPAVSKPSARHAHRHVERAAPRQRPTPTRAPSSFFTTLRTALPVRATADTARGIDSRSLKLAAGALLLVVAVGGSFLMLVSQTPRTR
jgi:hypothetical protein